MEGIYNHIETLSCIPRQAKNKTYDTLDRATKTVEGLMHFGGVITTAGEHVIGTAGLNLEPFEYTNLLRYLFLEKSTGQIAKAIGGNHTNVKLFYIAEDASRKIGIATSERGAMVGIDIKTDEGTREFPTGLEHSFIALIRNLHLERDVYPLVAPRTVFKQLIFDMASKPL